MILKQQDGDPLVSCEINCMGGNQHYQQQQNQVECVKKGTACTKAPLPKGMRLQEGPKESSLGDASLLQGLSVSLKLPYLQASRAARPPPPQA